METSSGVFKRMKRCPHIKQLHRWHLHQPSVQHWDGNANSSLTFDGVFSSHLWQTFQQQQPHWLLLASRLVWNLEYCISVCVTWQIHNSSTSLQTCSGQRTSKYYDGRWTTGKCLSCSTSLPLTFMGGGRGGHSGNNAGNDGVKYRGAVADDRWIF